MPSPFGQAGATVKPSKSAPLHTNRFFTGLWTNRSPLRDAATPFLYEKFYSASRFDSLIGGLNTEITTRLTLARRPGLSLYNAGSFPAIQRFYSFRTFVGGQEVIKVIADCGATVRDVTGPVTNTVLWTKAAGAGTSSFVSIGNSLYWTDGVNAKKWVVSSKVWTAFTAYTPGDFIVDSNNNLQVASLAVPVLPSFNIASIKVVRSQFGGIGPFYFFLVVTYGAAAPPFSNGTAVTFAGLTNYTALNGVTLTYNHVSPAYNLLLTANQIAFFYGSALYADTADTGTATGGIYSSGVTGGVQPTWNAVTGGLTADAGISWQNHGSSVEDWGLIAPTDPPSLSPVAPTRFWAASLHVPYNYYSILDSNGNVQVCPTAGITTRMGVTMPIWNTVLGGLTSELNTGGGFSTAVNWYNCGHPQAWQASIGYASPYQCILDSNNNLQIVITAGVSNVSQPAWATAIGATTVDNGVTWLCVGPGSVLEIGPVTYSYSYHSIDGSLSTAAPVAVMAGDSLGPAGIFQNLLQGPTSGDPQVDSVYLWRTAQGGSTLLLLTVIPNTTIGVVGTWSFTDSLPDSALNFLVQAPIALQGAPPPAAMTALEYHLGRIWGFIQNKLVYSAGPDILSGNGNTAFPPLNQFAYSSIGIRLWPTSIGLLALTVSDIDLVPGQGTSNQPFYSIPFQHGIGLLSWDAFALNGSTAYIMTTARRLVSLDPGAGLVEVGFPIGDQFQSLYNPASTYMTYHEGSSQDTGLFVGDGTSGWFRMSSISAPEAGNVWSPRAVIAAGAHCIKSIEVTPGQKRLLVGPTTTGPILMRDSATYRDNLTNYAAYANIGSIVLAQAGQMALVEHITCDSLRIGSRVGVGVLLGEISGTFEPLPLWRQDPPLLPPSNTLYGDRYYMMQTQQPIPCRHMQVQLSWPSENIANELLTYALYGEVVNE